MFCPNCGTQIEDTANFCPNCGSEISRNESSAAVITAPVGVEETPKDEARAVVKKIAGSGLFLAAAILFTVGILINLISSVGLSLVANGLYESYCALMGDMDAAVMLLMDALNSATSIGVIIGVIIGSIPNVLAIIGVWMIFGSAAKKENGCLSTSGFTICKGVTITSMVMTIVAFSIMILFSLIFLIAGVVTVFNIVDYEVGATFMIVGGGLFAILTPLLVFDIIYYAKLLKTIKAVSTTIETGMPIASVSRLVIFMCFFTGALNGIVSLISLSIGGMACAASFIIFGVILVKYRKQMTYLRDNGNTAAEATTEIQA